MANKVMTDREKLRRAMTRCHNCGSRILYDDKPWCDENCCVIQDVEDCKNWENGRGKLSNPEWDRGG